MQSEGYNSVCRHFTTIVFISLRMSHDQLNLADCSFFQETNSQEIQIVKNGLWVQEVLFQQVVAHKETLILLRGNVDNCLGQVKQKVFESLSPWGLFPSGQFYESCSQSTTRHPNTSKRSSAGSNSWASEVNLSIARVKVSALLQRIPRNSLLLSSSIAW